MIAHLVLAAPAVWCVVMVVRIRRRAYVEDGLAELEAMLRDVR